jgi:serine/threonine-protein kinase
VNTGVVTMRADGTGGAVPVQGTQYNDYPASVSPDGALLATVRINQTTSGDVYVCPLDGSGPPQPFLATPAYEGGGQFSPDGKWMLFTSDENGEPEVYLTPFPAADRRIAVSSDGGLHPLWSGDGRQIFYRAGQRMMAVDVTPGDEPRLSPPRVLFERQYKFGPNLSVPHYSLGLDGQSLLMVKEEAGARSLSFISQWLQRPGR